MTTMSPVTLRNADIRAGIIWTEKATGRWCMVARVNDRPVPPQHEVTYRQIDSHDRRGCSKAQFVELFEGRRAKPTGARSGVESISACGKFVG